MTPEEVLKLKPGHLVRHDLHGEGVVMGWSLRGVSLVVRFKENNQIKLSAAVVAPKLRRPPRGKKQRANGIEVHNGVPHVMPWATEKDFA